MSTTSWQHPDDLAALVEALIASNSSSTKRGGLAET
jgi:hypothetical protein